VENVKVKLSICYLSIFKLLLLEHRGVVFYKRAPIGFFLTRKNGLLGGLDDSLYGSDYIKRINTVMRYFKVPLKKILSLNGLGMKVAYSKLDSTLVFRLGYSHKPRVPVYPEITVSIKKNLIYLQSASKESLGLFAFKIRKLRFPDIYKGKGIWEKTGDKLLKIVKKK
jgi:hypothetical protein